MSQEGLFLGLHHNLQHVRQGFVTFWPRERLIEKMQTFVLDALASSQLTSGTASKIYGMMNFLEQGIYGRIGCSGLCAIKERQQETSRKMTPALQESLTLILEVLKLRPLREMEVIHRPVDRFVAASDAALEAPFEGSGGFLIVWFNGDTQQHHVGADSDHLCSGALQLPIQRAKRHMVPGQHRSVDGAYQRTFRFTRLGTYGPNHPLFDVWPSLLVLFRMD